MIMQSGQLRISCKYDCIEEIEPAFSHWRQLKGRLTILNFFSVSGILILRPGKPVFINMRLFTSFMPTFLRTYFPIGIFNIRRILRCPAALSMMHNPAGGLMGACCCPLSGHGCSPGDL